MDDLDGPAGPPVQRPLPPLPEPGAEVFLVTPEQRQAAVNHLDGELVRGVLDPAEAERRKQAVLVSTTVAELLAATSVEQPVVTSARSSGVADRPAVRTNVLALLAGLVVGVVLLVTVVPRFF